ncbi:MAG: hypothetical protein V4631_08675 [Pseudomonadota bacterium]
MKPVNLSALMLRLRLAVNALGPVFCAACLLVLVAGATLLWLVPQRALQAERQKIALALATMPAQVRGAATPLSANENLLRFYAALGEKRYAEQQVKTLFGLATKANLSLSQGEYKSAYDRNARLHTYQVTLPVKGSYRDVWQFSMLALGAIPFASLDEISFKRDSIGEANVEARLRLTMYLADKPAGALP